MKRRQQNTGVSCSLLPRKPTVIWPKYHFCFISICLSDAHLRAGQCSRQSQVSAALSLFHFCLFPAFQGFPYCTQPDSIKKFFRTNHTYYCEHNFPVSRQFLIENTDFKIHMKGQGEERDKQHFPLSSGERLKICKINLCPCIVFFYYSENGNKQFLPCLILASYSTHIELPNCIKIRKFEICDLTCFYPGPSFVTVTPRYLNFTTLRIHKVPITVS